MGARVCALLIATLILAWTVPISSSQAREQIPYQSDPAAAPAQFLWPHPPRFPINYPRPPGRPPRRVPVNPTESPLPQISRAAGTIFSGTVISILPARSGQSPPTVAITFRVEHAIRGVHAGQHLTIFQWIGLWSSGQRYRVGERVLLFLYPPSKLGLTSCVGGPMGRFDIDSFGRVQLSEPHLSVFRADPVLSRKSYVSLHDFTQAVRQARGKE
jgi:hypothetical protein